VVVFLAFRYVVLALASGVVALALALRAVALALVSEVVALGTSLHYRSIFNHCDIIGLKICRILWKNAK